MQIDVEGLHPKVAEKLDGKTFKEAWNIIRVEYNRITTDMRIRFGDTLWNAEKDRFYNDIEKEWLQLGKGLSNLKNEPTN